MGFAAHLKDAPLQSKSPQALKRGFLFFDVGLAQVPFPVSLL